jgi:hypothetical protein
LIPSSVVILGKSSFDQCKSLESVTFESGSRLERIEESAFHVSGLKSIEIPGSISFIDDFAFLETPMGKEEEEAREVEEQQVRQEALNAQFRERDSHSIVCCSG